MTSTVRPSFLRQVHPAGHLGALPADRERVPGHVVADVADPQREELRVGEEVGLVVADADDRVRRRARGPRRRARPARARERAPAAGRGPAGCPRRSARGRSAAGWREGAGSWSCSGADGWRRQERHKLVWSPRAASATDSRRAALAPARERSRPLRERRAGRAPAGQRSAGSARRQRPRRLRAPRASGRGLGSRLRYTPRKISST